MNERFDAEMIIRTYVQRACGVGRSLFDPILLDGDSSSFDGGGGEGAAEDAEFLDFPLSQDGSQDRLTLAAFSSQDSSPCHDEGMEETIPKGYVPMLVGGEEGEVERVLVRVRLLKDPRFAALLEMAAMEFGYRQQGILRVPWDAQKFRQMVDAISKSR
uniref:Uncharacterized protein LOC105046773 n=1 Tax=Elaeis guineensis var. tenera TaxID=51953 RepID=A0A6I9RBC5_ELAGV|nr:uncharacterized protein LOC105046773 [Elaeis guineensis]